MGMTDRGLADFRRAVRDRYSLSRSPTYGWLRQRYDQIAEMLAEKPAPSWTVIAEQLALIGLTNRDGGVPKADAVRKVWQRVAADVAASRARAAQRDAEQEAEATEQPTRRRRYGPVPKPRQPHEPEGSTLPDAVQHPSGIPPEVRLERLAGLVAGRTIPTGPTRRLKMATLGTTPTTPPAGEGGGVPLPRPAMPKPRLIHHHPTKRDGDAE